jgi:capsular exopolysaccharide synthesis family protein
MHRSSSPAGDVVDLGEYIAVIRRRFWLVLATVITSVAIVTAYSFARTPVYTARAVVLVEPATDSTQFRPDQLVSLDTEARLVKSALVAAVANETIQSSAPVTELLKRVDVEVTPDTLVLDILYTDTSATRAAAGANAFAEAYLEYKSERANDSAALARAEILSRIDDLEVELATLEDAAAGSLEERRAELLTAQIGVLTTRLAEAAPTGDPGEVIVPATPPPRPSSPKLLLNVATALVIGTILGIALAFIRDRLDDRISDLEDLELTIEGPVLATIPHAADGPNDQPWLITQRQPRSPAAEAFRTLRTSVIALGRQQGLKTLAIVSAAPGDGKTTTCANLGVALSHTDSRVLLLAADLRRPTLARCFEVELGIGTAEVLMGEASLADAVQQVAPSLWLMTSGHPPERPAELLQSPRLAALLDEAKGLFDFVLIDCPAIMGLADTLSVAPHADASIVIARVESSKRTAIVRAIERLEQVGGRFVGAVLNDVALSKRTREYGYGYGYQPLAERRAGDRPTEAPVTDGGRRGERVGPREVPLGSDELGGPADVVPHPVGQPERGVSER